MISSKPTVAFFDFDGTITTQDSFLPFIQWTHNPYDIAMAMCKHSPAIFSYLLGFSSNQTFKEICLTQFYSGWSIDNLQKKATEFAYNVLPSLLNNEAIDNLKWHQKKGHQIILVSAALHIYLDPWAKIMQIDHVLANYLQVHNGYVIGKIQGKNCYGLEKVKRLEAFLGDLNRYYIYAYGDSRGDSEMLAVADQPNYRKFGQGQFLMIR